MKMSINEINIINTIGLKSTIKDYDNTKNLPNSSLAQFGGDGFEYCELRRFERFDHYS